MKIDNGIKLLEILRKQREFFIQTTDGKKIITNHLVYNAFEEEAFKLQIKIGAENKKLIKMECDRMKIPYPNFRKEGIAKI